MDHAADYLAELVAAGLLIPMGVDGVYGRSARFEDVIERLNARISRWGAENRAEAIRFPPVMTLDHFERSGYLKSFPQLAGAVRSFTGDDRDHAALLKALDAGADWGAGLAATRVVMTPAACYSLYPMVAAQGPLPTGGRLLDVYSWCFRHEPSLDPTRQQLFRMREYVRIGTPDAVVQFREDWLERGQQLVGALGLPFAVDVANDPFFGRQGKLLASAQREQSLKFELLVPITSAERPTACLSFNYAQDHFGQLWGIQVADGAPAHSACVAFGLERITLALFRHHGLDPEAWPDPVRAQLWA